MTNLSAECQAIKGTCNKCGKTCQYNNAAGNFEALFNHKTADLENPVAANILVR